MEAIGLEVINTFNRQSKQTRTTSETDKGDFLKTLDKMFSTVEFNEVQRAYLAEHSWFKKNTFEIKLFQVANEDAEELSDLYKEYRKILLRLYRMRQILKDG